MNNSEMPSQRLEDFVEALLREKNLPGMTEDVLPDLIKEVTSQLRELIDMAIVDALPAEKQQALHALLEKQDTTPETVSKFIEQSGLDLAKVTADSLARFRELYLQGPEAKS